MENISNSHSFLIKNKAIKIASLWRQNILQWYKINGRVHLPWRNLKGKHSAYGVYVSEMMLQQTQVKRVLEQYYMPFMHSFPTLKSLALATQEEVLKLWEGLGYYTRARNMHQTALICHEQYHDNLPSSYEELLALPGIGRYTAGAILCFGLGKSVAFVDGNIKRLLCRIFALSNPKPKLLEELAYILLEREHSFIYNQALIDLGAMICTPKSPACLICPLNNLCDGSSATHLYPAPKSSALIPLTLHLAFCVHKDCIALIRSSQRLYNGLYNLPSMPEKEVPKIAKYAQFKHHYTKYVLNTYVHKVSYQELKHALKNEISSLTWLSYEALSLKPLSSLCKKALKSVGYVF